MQRYFETYLSLLICYENQHHGNSCNLSLSKAKSYQEFLIELIKYKKF